MGRIKAVLFDLDGTLVDSFADIASSINHVLDLWGRPPKSIEEVKSHVGYGIRKMLEDTFEVHDEKTMDRAVAMFREHYWEHCVDESRLYPGVMECLESLDGLVKAVVTNKTRVFAEKIITALGARDFFDAVFGGDDYPAMKPDPAAVKFVCESLEIDPTLALMLGDGYPDIHSAVGAGAMACGVTHGIGTVKEMKEAGAAFIIDSLAELPAHLRAIK